MTVWKASNQIQILNNFTCGHATYKPGVTLKLLCPVQRVNQVVLLGCPLVTMVKCGRFGAVEVLVVVASGCLVSIVSNLIIDCIVSGIRIGLVAGIRVGLVAGIRVGLVSGILAIDILVVEFIVRRNFC